LIPGAGAGVPVPLTPTWSGDVAESLAMFRVAEKPPADPGAKVTSTWQLVPAVTVVPEQPSLAIPKAPGFAPVNEKAEAPTVMSVSPLLVTVTVWLAGESPTWTLPRSTGLGVNWAGPDTADDTETPVSVSAANRRVMRNSLRRMGQRMRMLPPLALRPARERVTAIDMASAIVASSTSVAATSPATIATWGMPWVDDAPVAAAGAGGVVEVGGVVVTGVVDCCFGLDCC
jgi:hypothetical protein